MPAGVYARISAEARFWCKVNKNGPLPPHRPELGRCWVWVAGKSKRGYGKFIFEGKNWRAHRFAWFLKHGRVKDCILHKCDNPSCVRHLFSGNMSENILDCVAKGRHPLAKRTRCSHGHEYSLENTCLESGHRRCITCRRANETRRRRAKGIMPRPKRLIKRREGRRTGDN